jgi:hypothetical protein
VSRIGLFDPWVSRFAEPERLFGTLPPGDVSRLPRLEAALDSILPEGPKQVAELAEIEPDRPFQIRNPFHTPRLVVFLGQLAHVNQNVDEADEPLLPKQLGRRSVHTGDKFSAIHRTPSMSPGDPNSRASHAFIQAT